MFDIIVLTVGMLSFVALGALINRFSQNLWWWFYEWKLSREDERMIEEAEAIEKADNIIKFRKKPNADE